MEILSISISVMVDSERRMWLTLASPHAGGAGAALSDELAAAKANGAKVVVLVKGKATPLSEAPSAKEWIAYWKAKQAEENVKESGLKVVVVEAAGADDAVAKAVAEAGARGSICAATLASCPCLSFLPSPLDD